MQGDIELINVLDKSIGEKAFVINVSAKVLESHDLGQNEKI